MSNLSDFQELIASKGYTCYIVPTSDSHNSEYVSDYFKAREYLSGFTGSAGILIVFEDSAYLWTDGRYFIQAEHQLEGSGITLMKAGTKDTPRVSTFLHDKLKDNDVVGFDGTLLTASYVEGLLHAIDKKITLKTGEDLVNSVWKKRPALPFSLLYKLDTFFSGKSTKDKISDLRAKMKECNTNTHILSSLTDIAWLFNLRGNDIEYTPVFLSYAVITLDQVYLFIDQAKLNIEVQKYLDENDITVKDYNDFYDFINTLKNKQILIDKDEINYKTYSIINSNNNKLINEPNPTSYSKAIKNETEIKNIKDAHLKDARAMVRFMNWLYKELDSAIPLNELAIQDKLDGFRAAEEGFVELSFSTICGYKEHGAIVHYSSSKETNIEVTGNGLLLIDSGGHYLEGTTDITRTFAIGKVNDQAKTAFTNVLKSHIALAEAIFPSGTTHKELDTISRMPLWKTYQDYRHGTGHGVGYLLSVHEGPNSSRANMPITVGTITTDEPGLYVENKFGVRIESELLCVKKESTEYGEFLGFENLTYVPIDINAIKPSLLTKFEKEWLNNYHKTIYEKISPMLNDEEKEFLKKITEAI